MDEEIDLVQELTPKEDIYRRGLREQYEKIIALKDSKHNPRDFQKNINVQIETAHDNAEQ